MGISFTGSLSKVSTIKLRTIPRYWIATLHSSGNDTASGIFSTANAVYMCGSESNYGIITKYSPNGNLLWQKNLDGGYVDYPRSISIASDAIFVTGYSHDGNYYNIVTAKLDLDGVDFCFSRNLFHKYLVAPPN